MNVDQQDRPENLEDQVYQLEATLGPDLVERLAEVAVERRVVITITVQPYVDSSAREGDDI